MAVAWQTRLEEWMAANRLRQVDLARKLDRTPQYIHDVLTGRRKLRADFATQLLDIGVDLNWLLGPAKSEAAKESPAIYAPGVTEALLRDIREELKQSLGKLVDVRPHTVWREAGETEIEPDDYVAVPVLADAAAAGSGRLMSEDVEEYALIHRRALSHPDNVRCVRVRGDSMEPTLPDGSIVAVDTALKNIERAVGRIVCARTESEEVVIKRLWWGENRQYVVLEPEDSSQQHERIAVDLAVSPDPLIGTIVWAWIDLSGKIERGSAS